jgi:hypothetical protein
MSEVALILLPSQDLIAEPFRKSSSSGGPGLVLVLATGMLVLLLAVEAVIAAARVLLDPVFALIRTLFRLLFVLGAVVAIVLLLASGSAHGAGPTDAGSGQAPAGTLR